MYIVAIRLSLNHIYIQLHNLKEKLSVFGTLDGKSPNKRNHTENTGDCPTDMLEIF